MDNYTGEVEITFDDVVNYWMTLFPEIKEKNEFENIFKTVSNYTLEDLENKYNSNEKQIDINKYFEQYDSKVNLTELFNKIQGEYPWVFLFKPIIQFYSDEFYETLRKVKSIDNMDELFNSIIITIVNRLDIIAYKVMVLETNVARLENMLEGETPEEKAAYFRNSLLRDETYLKSLFNEYEELTIILDNKVRMTFDFFKDIIIDTDREINSLKKVFNNNLGRLKEVTIGAGDTHNGGKSVSVLKFSCGTTLIYKPRNLELEENFYEFIEWFNEAKIENLLDLKAPRVYRCNNGGWVECIKYDNCNNLDEIKNFYYRIGELLAILYSLNSKDFHFENLIAQGEYPVLIDLETFLHPDLHAVDRENADAGEIAMEIISSSVDGIGLLPSPIINKKTKQAIDVGGLSGNEEQLSPFKSVFVKDIDTDYISIVKDYGYISTNKNNPKINNKVQSSNDYIEIMKEAFKVTYMWILNNKDIYEDKILSLFSANESRVLFRSTYIYSQILSTSYHPDLLRKPIDRWVYLHRIGILAVEELKDIVSSEIKDLMLGDIPCFKTYTDENKVLNSEDESIKTQILRSAIDTIKLKLSNLSLEDLERQISFIDITFATKLNKTDEDITNISFSNNDSYENINKNEWLELSENIAEEMLIKSIEGNKNGIVDRTWLGSFSSGDEQNHNVYLSKVGTDLYGGNSGIALFYAHLAKITKKNKYKKIALEAIKPVQEWSKNIENGLLNNVGAFTGISGELYAIFEVGRAVEDDGLINDAKEKILKLEEAIVNSYQNDIISGAAGALGVILHFYENETDVIYLNKLLKMCNSIFEKYKKCFRSIDGMPGITWDEEGYVGFSHGNAGIIAYLAKLYNITKNNEILEVINQSLLYERRMYNEENKNWYNKESKENLAFGWCHGAPGILLSRLMLKQYGCADEYVDKEIEIALMTTKNEAIGRNVCMCHGDLGNLRIIKYAAEILNDNDLENKCIFTFSKLFDEFLLRKWNKGVFRGTENYGLMVGLAGFGYACLQNYSLETMPEVLWLS